MAVLDFAATADWVRFASAGAIAMLVDHGELATPPDLLRGGPKTGSEEGGDLATEFQSDLKLYFSCR